MALRLAERTGREESIAPSKLRALDDWARYASVVRGLIAGQGGFVKGTKFSSVDVREAVKSLSSEPRAEVAGKLADNATWWQSLL